MQNWRRGQLSVDSLLVSSLMLWTVVHEPFWLEIHFLRHVASYFFINLRHRWVVHLLISFFCVASTPPGRLDQAVSVSVSGNLAVFAGPLWVKNQRATKSGVDVTYGGASSSTGEGRSQESGKKHKSHAAGKAHWKFLNITSEDLWDLQKNLIGRMRTWA